MNKINIQFYKSPVGELIIGSFEDKLVLADWRYRKMRDQIDKRIQSKLQSEYSKQTSPVIEMTIVQLEEYFAGKRQEFDIPILMVGTDFQKQVWVELQKIPFGKTATYLQLAQNMNNPNAVRAVANANGANAISIIIPCHRIIGSDGKLVGYAGGLQAKKKLLELEDRSQLGLF